MAAGEETKPFRHADGRSEKEVHLADRRNGVMFLTSGKYNQLILRVGIDAGRRKILITSSISRPFSSECESFFLDALEFSKMHKISQNKNRKYVHSME